MSMVKLASPGDWGLTSVVPVEIKVSSRGFMRGDQLKVASEVGDRFIHEVRAIEDKLDRDNYKYAHIISCGATEKTGANRNGDGWRAAVLERDMPSYVKHARFYRDHINKQTSPAYGHVKIAFYDGDRGFGRLLAALNATSKVARERDEHVADLEIDSLEKLGEIKVSHGTRVGSDTCVHCGNVASKRSEYCKSSSEGGKCPLFGCRFGLSKVADDGRVQFVDNPKNIFYDISSIGLTPRSANQADRVAFGSLFDLDSVKTAAAVDGGAVLGSAWMAEQLGITPRLDLQDFSQLTPHQQKLAHVAVRLAELESTREFSAPMEADSNSKLAALHHSSPAVRRSAVLSLAQRMELPGPFSYAKAAGLDDSQAFAVQNLAADLLCKLAAEEKLSDLIAASDFTKSPATLSLVDVRAPSCKLSQSNVSRSVKVAAISGPHEKFAAAAPADGYLVAKHAADYAAMKVLFASQILGTKENADSLIASVQEG